MVLYGLVSTCWVTLRRTLWATLGVFRIMVGDIRTIVRRPRRYVRRSVLSVAPKCVERVPDRVLDSRPRSVSLKNVLMARPTPKVVAIGVPSSITLQSTVVPSNITVRYFGMAYY